MRVLRQAVLGILATTQLVGASNFLASSQAGQRLLAHSQGRELREEENNNNNFLTNYAIKFQGCHQIMQWNDQSNGEDDVRVQLKGLVRYRLCEASSCSDNTYQGCSTKYGDYIVDMNTFVQEYLTGMQDLQEQLCEQANQDCDDMCNNDDDCLGQCMESYNLNCNDGNQYYDFDVATYAQCAQIDFYNNGRHRHLEDEYNNNGQQQYYVGAYCANQGGEIRLGIFSDDTCSVASQNGENLFYNTMKFKLPYSDESMISNRCLTCSAQDNNGDGQNQAIEMCSDLYAGSGKCETKMSIDYPNEASCDYIEGVKIVREDGIIRTNAVKKSKAAAVVIGLSLTLAVLLAAYVAYLRTKLHRAQINLDAY